jgi:hypothetical protein
MKEFFQPEAPKKEENPIDKDLFYKLTKQKLSQLFSMFPTSRECIDEFISENGDMFKDTENGDSMKVQLQQCGDIKDKRLFVETVFEILKPAYDHMFDALEGFTALEIKERVQVNEFLSYDIQENKLNVHVFSGGLEGSFAKYAEGLCEVARVIEQHKEVESVEAVSWIVVKHPKILERLGFTIEKEDNGQPKVETSNGEVTGHASMTREDFLKKYLK